MRGKETVSNCLKVWPNPENLMAYNYVVLDPGTQKCRYILLLKFRALMYLLLIKQANDNGHVECGYK